MSGSGPIYEYQRELTARLEQALRERDEAREAARKYREVAVKAQQALDEARAGIRAWIEREGGN